MVYCVNRVKFEKETGYRTAGKKAPDDVAYYAAEAGAVTFAFQEAHLYKNKYINAITAVFYNLKNWIRLWMALKNKDTVILQHPYEGIKLCRFFLYQIKQRKNVKVIILIHDLLNLRNGIESHQTKATTAVNSYEEVKILELADNIICHNEKMKMYMTEVLRLNENIITCLELFDYRHDCMLPEYRTFDKSITIAGNLLRAKSEYIYKLISEKEFGCKLHLYGPNYDASIEQENVIYHGLMAPDILPGKLEGAFGLVWDGFEITTCAGISGEYLRYNNPHKCSLFLASNMPVIIWKEAALASFVEDNGVGITVDSLLDIGEAIDKLTEEQYAQMLSNTIKVGEMIRSGHFLKQALGGLF